jgi:hypothetical protein
LKLAVPELCDLEDQNLEIWETQARGPLLRPRNSIGKLDPAQIYSGLWTVEGEQAYFQRYVVYFCLEGYAGGNNVRFAFYRRHSLAESLTCIVLFLVHKKTHVARIVA